jgi:hypothetical protein
MTGNLISVVFLPKNKHNNHIITRKNIRQIPIGIFYKINICEDNQKQRKLEKFSEPGRIYGGMMTELNVIYWMK